MVCGSGMNTPWIDLNKAPEGATHCFKPFSDHDPLFYRMVEGELQIWGMAINKWLVSKHDPDYINSLCELE
jgi:hypothetical protein